MFEKFRKVLFIFTLYITIFAIDNLPFLKLQARCPAYDLVPSFLRSRLHQMSYSPPRWLCMLAQVSFFCDL